MMLINIPSWVANPTKCDFSQTTKEWKKERFILVNNLLFFPFIVFFLGEKSELNHFILSANTILPGRQIFQVAGHYKFKSSATLIFLFSSLSSVAALVSLLCLHPDSTLPHVAFCSLEDTH